MNYRDIYTDIYIYIHRLVRPIGQIARANALPAHLEHVLVLLFIIFVAMPVIPKARGRFTASTCDVSTAGPSPSPAQPIGCAVGRTHWALALRGFSHLPSSGFRARFPICMVSYLHECLIIACLGPGGLFSPPAAGPMPVHRVRLALPLVAIGSWPCIHNLPGRWLYSAFHWLSPAGSHGLIRVISGGA